MVKIETSREHRTRPGQNNGTIVELRFEKVECLVKISEEGWILRVDLVGVHRHDGHMRVFSFNYPRHRTSSNLGSRSADSRKLKVSSLNGEANVRRLAVSRPRSFRT